MSENVNTNSNGNNNQNGNRGGRQHRHMKPWVKWTLIGVGAVVVIGGVTYLIINGKKVPAKAVAKIAETAPEVLATV